jgi:hypothetical protein
VNRVSGFRLLAVSVVSRVGLGEGEPLFRLVTAYVELLSAKYTPACTDINTDSDRIRVINRCFVCNLGANYAEKEVNLLIL